MPAQEHGGYHAACSAPSYQNNYQPAPVNTEQNSNMDTFQVQGQNGWVVEQPALIESVLAHGRGAGSR